MVLTTADRLRLDVGIAQAQEAYSWVGENRFADQSLFKIVGQGAISTGYFHGFLTLIFRMDNAVFSYLGETQDGQKLKEYSFEVSLEKSHYIFRANSHAYTTAYEGTLTADPQTAELVSLTVRTRNLSAESGACEVDTSMNYTRWRVNDTKFLLPALTRMDIRDVNGVESHNETMYTGCHEFLGTSTLHFVKPGEGQAAVPSTRSQVPTAALPIRAGPPLTLQLAQDIPVATAAAGDPVRALLATDLRSARRVLAPKGTPLICRIQEIRRYYNAPSTSVVGAFVPAARLELLLRLESLTTAGGPLAIIARPAMPTPQPRRPGTLARRGAVLGPLSAMGSNLWFRRFVNAGDNYVIPSEIASDWVTEAR